MAHTQCRVDGMDRMFFAACLVYWRNTRIALVTYGVLGFGGLAHYVMPQARSMPMRCTLTIGTEAASSVLLIAYALLRSRMNPDRSVARQ